MPGLIRNDISDFDRTVTGYLKADPERVESIRNELQLDGKTVIGVSWKSFKSLNKVKKSVQLRDMGRMFAGLDVVLVNLQYGDVDDEIREFKEETGIDVLQCASVDNREDLDGLAALIEACDIGSINEQCYSSYGRGISKRDMGAVTLCSKLLVALRAYR